MLRIDRHHGISSLSFSLRRAFFTHSSIQKRKGFFSHLSCFAAAWSRFQQCFQSNMVRAWYMDDDEESDQRLPHRKDENDVTREVLDSLGVLQWSGIDGGDDPTLAKIKEERGYTYTDTINVSPGKLEGYEQKIKNFYREHIHYDEEIRFCLDGSGYFDIRDKHDKWIRVSVEKGDLIILPEGSYHRFTCDASDYILAMVSDFISSIICTLLLSHCHSSVFAYVFLCS